MIGICISVIVLSFCIRLSSSVSQKNQLDVFTNEMKSAIQYAKLQSLMRGKKLVLRPVSSTNDWSAGMVLFVDNKTHEYRSDKDIVHQWHWKEGAIQISWHGFQSSSFLVFTPALSSQSLNGTFVFENNVHEQKKLIINRLGRVKDSP